MKVIPKLQQGNTIESDNTKVVRPEIHEPIKAKPRQYSIVDLGGEPSNDTRSAAERNRDYWHPIKGAKARFKASMSNETNPLVGIERTILPSAAGAALVTTPAAVVGGALGNMTVDKLTGGWGNWLEDKTGIPSEIGVYTNPGAWYGGAKGYKIGKNKLITKSIKGDADLAWNPINKNHWIFNKEARTPSNIAMATANRITPFLSKIEKLPLKVAAYKAAKRWNDSPNTANQVRLTKQAALMDKVGRPFILQQSNPIWVEGKSVRNPELVTMAHGGRFDFKKSPLLKKQEEINGKRDMCKKFIKSSRPTYKKRIKKAQQGMKFVSYNPVSNPTIDYTDITNPINPFSEYNYNTTYDKPEALVVPVRDTEETDVVANNPTVEPVINKSVASKSVTDKPVTKTANSTWKSPYTNRKQWSTELINAYKKAGITNDNAIRMLLAQDALESSWGKSAQGKYNFGNLTTGSSWKGDYVTGNDKNAKGEAIKQKFRSYNSMDEYAADKIQFLKRLYDFDENDDINKFVAKLTGSNKGKRRYAEATNYAKVLTGVYNGIPKGENGMIIKYQEPAQPINRRDAIRDYRPDIPNRIRKATPAEHIQSMINIYGQSEQPTVTSDAKSPWQHQQAHEAARKGYDDYMQAKKYEEGLHNLNGILTFTDYATLATGLGSLLSKGASMAGKQVGKQMAKRAIRRESRKHIPSNSDPFLNLGRSFNDFGNPRRSITESLNNFIEYLNDPETIKRLQDIDKELGTRYMEGRQWFLDEAAKGNIKFNPIEMWDGNNRIINGMKYPNYSQTLIGDPFLSNPSYKNITTNIVKQDHPSTIGHEVKHGIENYLEVLNKPNMTMEGFKSQHGSGKRLQALFDKDNIKSFEEWRASIKADPQFRTASDEAITNMYNYLTQESEFSSNLHPLVEANIIKGRPGVPNYRDLADFEDVLNNSYYAPPWAAGRDPMTNVKLIYNHLIKDKHRFLSKLNKYGWGIAALGVGMNLMNY